MPEQVRRYLDVDPGGGSAEEAGPKPRAQDLEQSDAHERREDHVERADPAMTDDLVDDQQECYRRGQRQALQEQGTHQQLGQHPAASCEGGAQRRRKRRSGFALRTRHGSGRGGGDAGPVTSESPTREPPRHLVARPTQLDPQRPERFHQPPDSALDFDQGGRYQLAGGTPFEANECDGQAGLSHRPRQRLDVDTAALAA